MSTSLKEKVADLENRMVRFESQTSERPARMGRAVDSGSEVFPLVLVSYDPQSDVFMAKRVVYKNSPPEEGDIEFDGDEFQVYPPPGFASSQLQMPGLIFGGVINDVTKLHIVPLLGVVNPQGDTEAYITLKPIPTATFLPPSDVQVQSEGSGG